MYNTMKIFFVFNKSTKCLLWKSHHIAHEWLKTLHKLFQWVILIKRNTCCYANRYWYSIMPINIIFNTIYSFMMQTMTHLKRNKQILWPWNLVNLLLTAHVAVIFMYTTLYQWCRLSGNMFEQYYRGPLPTYERSELASKAKGHSDEKSNGAQKDN